MGEDKALIQIDGVALAARMASRIAAVGCSPTYIVGRQPGLSALGWPVIAEKTADHHPLFGVAAALRCAEEGLALIAPCDLIHLREEAIRALLAHDGPCVAEGPCGVHPLLGVLPAALAAQAHSLACSGTSAQRLVAHLPRLSLPSQDLLDANRPVDLSQPAE